MPALQFTVALRVVRRSPHMIHTLDLNESLEILRHKLWPWSASLAELLSEMMRGLASGNASSARCMLRAHPCHAARSRSIQKSL